MRAAKQVIFNHVLDTCYLSLKKKYTGYVNNMYLEIYNNLIEEYEEFSDDEMQENDMLMKKEKTGEKRFEDSLQKIEDCVKNVASQNPYTPAQKVLIGFKNIDKCGFYSDDCRYWRRKSNLEKTLPTFKVHFVRPLKNTRESNKTTGNSSYANIVSQIQTGMQTIENENVQSLANYANKSAADTNATKTLKEQIIEIKAAQTSTNGKQSNLKGQVGDTRQYYFSNNN